VSPDRARPTIAVTSGEPAGIGPELCATLLAEPPANLIHARLLLIGDRELLARSAGRPFADDAVLHVPLAAPSQPGRLDPANARYVLALLDAGIDGCLAGRFDALVTAPVHKGVINDAGVPFTGHTEYLAERCGTVLPVMMLVGGGLRVALATTHLPLAAVSAALTATRLDQLPSTARRFLSVTERSRVVLVPVEDVVYLKAELKYITIRTVQREYLLEESLTRLEEEFGPRFVRVHRNCLVARDFIRGFERRVGDEGDAHWEVLLRDVAESLPVSRRQQFVVREIGRENQ